MVKTQVSWRCSKKALFLLLLFVPTHTFSMEFAFKKYTEWKHGKQEVEDEYPIPSIPLDENENKPVEEPEYGFVPEMTEEQKRNYVCHGRPYSQMVEVFEDAPRNAQLLVDHLKNPLAPNWQTAFFVGPTGTGKSTAALAVPHLAHWHWLYKAAPEFSGTYRNETKERLADFLRCAVSQKKKVVVIIDELNRILENFDSKHHDADATASYLWTFLDEQKYNPNFFFIGTMNREDKLPDQVKHRFGGSSIYFPQHTPEKLRDIFKKQMNRNPQMEFDEECDDVFIDSCIELFKNSPMPITPRDYENILLEVSRDTFADDRVSKVRKAKQSHIQNGIKFVVGSYVRSKLGKEDITQEEWRDFNAVQSRIIDIQLQCAQKVQMGVSLGIFPSINVGRSAGLDKDEAIGIVEREFSRDQIALYRRFMKLGDDEPLMARGTIDSLKHETQSAITEAANFVGNMGAEAIEGLKTSK